MRPTSKLNVITFGCRLNALESETMRRRAAEAGIADAVLVNTCAVTAEAVRQARQAIRHAKREQPHRPVIVAGCAAQIDPDGFAAMPEVDRVLGNAEKLDAVAYASDQRVRVGDIMAVRTASTAATTIPGHTRGFVEIQNGCDHRCTFCVIPLGRGNSRSVPMATVIGNVRALVEAGHGEVVLTGVDITSYDAPNLGTLVRAILRDVPELRRLRLSSIDSIEADRDLIIAIAEEERLMPYLHLSLQHGDDLILKRMKRRHARADAVRFTDAVRRLRPDIVFGADLIAGFPTETDAMAAQSLALVDDCGLTTLHVFPYSPRPHTPAARMPQVDGATIHARAAALRTKGARAFAAHLAAEQGTTRRLLVENGGVGRTPQFTPARIDATPGTFVDARIVGHNGRGLIAEAA
ncbi:MAG TPA: tRNA (N(6)-L-threonylcarbamoyladenosine(37)-C(2))-methylthiotransferase MtaB [Bauldia sp.]|nr:tRNA (N(6)-L-threonylcarbamoyladenosine(37)-C(2))-methylthiotransferase MtaB [Bauldia sp.]